MKPEEQAGAKSAAFVESLLLPLMNLLAGPIRVFYLAIGHATVASWALLSFSVAGVGWMWTDMIERLNYPVRQAEVAHRDSMIREIELRILEREASLGIVVETWMFATLNLDHESQLFMMKFIPLKDASSVIVQWTKVGGGEGIRSSQIRPPGPEGFDVVTFPFPPEWEVGDEVVFNAAQETSDGRRFRWMQGGRTETIQ